MMFGLIEIAVFIAIVVLWPQYGFWGMAELLGPWLVIGWVIELAFKITVIAFVGIYSIYTYSKGM